MRVSEILQPDCVTVSLESDNKQQAIYALVDLLCDRKAIEAREELKKAIWQREQTRTTGIGHGVAIPHGKCEGCQRLSMAVALPTQPIDFGSIDGRPVDLIILLASPVDQTGPHIQALATISRMLTDETFRAAIKKASSPDEVYNLITQHETAQTP